VEVLDDDARHFFIGNTFSDKRPLPSYSVSFYLTWIYKKGHCGSFIFQPSTLLPNKFEANIQKLEGYIFSYIQNPFHTVWSVLGLHKSGICRDEYQTTIAQLVERTGMPYSRPK